MSGAGPRSVGPAQLLVACWLVLVPSLSAQTAGNLGPTSCTNCHDHQPEKEWAEKIDGPPPRGHVNALKQLESPKARGWAQKMGVRDVYDPGGTCVRCHATVVANDASAGVTCESCHGPGQRYIVVHQDKGAYAKAVSAGLFDTRNNPRAWVPLCVSCHVTDDRRLVAAGHPSGDDFDASTKMTLVAKHWKTPVSPVLVASESRLAVAALLAKRADKPGANTSTASVSAVSSAASVAGGAPPSPVAAVAAAEGRLLLALQELLRRGAYVSQPIAPPAAVPYAGPDAALLRLQQEIVNLALEALSSPPASAGDPRPRP
jgi:hypothetical protein